MSGGNPGGVALRAASRSVYPDQLGRPACEGMDTAVFYPETRGRTSNADAAVAVATCQRCAVRAACLEYAQAIGESYGIWGGLNAYQRKARRTAGQAGKAAAR